MGDRQFVEEEGIALLNLNVQGSIISLTGSNPLHAKSMAKMAKSGVVVYLDVSNHSIIRRLNMMKVDRIVGQQSGNTMTDILNYRRTFYEQWYDVRIICEEDETPESIVNKV